MDKGRGCFSPTLLSCLLHQTGSEVHEQFSPAPLNLFSLLKIPHLGRYVLNDSGFLDDVLQTSLHFSIRLIVLHGTTDASARAKTLKRHTFHGFPQIIFDYIRNAKSYSGLYNSACFFI